MKIWISEEVKRWRKKIGEVENIKKKRKRKNKCLGDWVYSFLAKIFLNPIIKTNSKVIEK